MLNYIVFMALPATRYLMNLKNTKNKACEKPNQASCE